MSVFHFYDTSALLKNYVDEKGSIWLRQQLCAIDALHVIGALTPCGSICVVCPCT